MLDFILHLDREVPKLVLEHGPWAYGILFGVIFAETGFIVFPFLPGDSLLFMLGVFSTPPKSGGPPAFNVYAIFGLLSTAAILGDQVNYQFGRYFGQKLFKDEKSRFFKPSNLKLTHEFYEKHGPKTVLLARFVPVVRALAPFVAGMGGMQHRVFTLWSVSGAFLWVGVCVFAGHLFGNIPFVRERFEYVILFILLCSIIPAVIEYLRHRARTKKAASP
ncbi:MAG: DedA family protein [Fimbriimonas sp.]